MIACLRSGAGKKNCLPTGRAEQIIHSRGTIAVGDCDRSGLHCAAGRGDWVMIYFIGGFNSCVCCGGWLLGLVERGDADGSGAGIAAHRTDLTRYTVRRQIHARVKDGGLLGASSGS